MSIEGDRWSDSCPGPLDESELAGSRDLAAQARAGDARAAGALLERYEQRLLRIIRIRLGAGLRRYLESGDVLQETFHAALRALRDVDLPADDELLPWLARIAENRMRDEHDRWSAAKRSARREQELGDDSRAQVELPPTSETAPPDRAARNELRELVDDAIAKLPEDYREVVLLRDYCGASWESIHARLRRESVHATQQLHQRAWLKIRREVEPRLRPRS